MPDTPGLQAHFGQHGQQKGGCGFPTATLLVLCTAAGFITRAIALPLRSGEATRLPRLHDELGEGDVLVYDRAGSSYTHLALLMGRGLHGIMRMHQKRIVDFRDGRGHAGQMPKRDRGGKPTSQWLERLGPEDQLVRWFRPDRPKGMTNAEYQALPESLVLRELRYKVQKKGFRTRSVTLVTTLCDAREYPAAELAGQYLGRWGIEVNPGHLKTTPPGVKMDVLKCKSVDGIMKELMVFTLVYNLVRLVMLKAAQQQGVAVDRIGFADALRWLRDARGGGAPPGLIVNPARDGRVEPRVVKRRPKPLPLMTQPRDTLRQALLSRSPAA